MSKFRSDTGNAFNMSRRLYLLIFVCILFTSTFYFISRDRLGHSHPAHDHDHGGPGRPALDAKNQGEPLAPGWENKWRRDDRAGGQVQGNDKTTQVLQSVKAFIASRAQGASTGTENKRVGNPGDQANINQNGQVKKNGREELDKETADARELARHLLTNRTQSLQSHMEVQETLSDQSRTNIQQICPPEYKIGGPDDLWFRTKVVQRSPLENLTDDKPYIVILTPISNSERSLQMYFNNLCSFDYPHHLISVVLGEDSSIDRTIEVAKRHVEKLKPFFRRMEFVKLRTSGVSASRINRHEKNFQFIRRKQLAMSRNQLINAGIRDEKWVLWIDSDVKHIPTDILQRLLAVNKQIIAPNCLYKRETGDTDTFDRNTWRETEDSKRFLDTLPSHVLMLEGYEPTKRRFLNHLKEEGDVVKIDGVGGCVLLVEADLHRSGLVFPAFTFEHHIETEGLSKMATKMGISLYGLPSVNVIHA